MRRLELTYSADAHITLKREHSMLTTIAVVLVLLWALGLLGGYAMGGLIHTLLVIAVVIFLARLVTGRRVVV